MVVNDVALENLVRFASGKQSNTGHVAHPTACNKLSVLHRARPSIAEFG